MGSLEQFKLQTDLWALHGCDIGHDTRRGYAVGVCACMLHEHCTVHLAGGVCCLHLSVLRHCYNVACACRLHSWSMAQIHKHTHIQTYKRWVRFPRTKALRIIKSRVSCNYNTGCAPHTIPRQNHQLEWNNCITGRMHEAKPSVIT